MSVLLVGLERLSYRGYDSAGISVVTDDELNTWKKKGNVRSLARQLASKTVLGSVGIGHTRWATHGIPNTINAHPHANAANQCSIVHNGIIENYLTLRNRLIKMGYLFRSETDSEVIVHLIDHYFEGSLTDAVQCTVEQLEGSFAFCAVHALANDFIVAARKNSPLIIGVGDGEHYISSDVNALGHYTKNVIYLEDNHIATLSKNNIHICDFSGESTPYHIDTIQWKASDVEKNGYDHFMQKEIHEQPVVIQSILSRYLKGESIHFPAIGFSDDTLASTSRFIIQACGTSWHAGLVGKYFIESLGRISTEVDVSSEFRYRQVLNNADEIVVAISQSGETADTLASIRTAKSHFSPVLSFVNVEGSAIARESDGVIHTHAGPEIGVASTKNYIGQILTLYLFSLYLSRIRGIISLNDYRWHIQNIQELPQLIASILSQESAIEALVDSYVPSKSVVFIGRGLNYPTAMEGALKLKELSYIHATGYPAGELKHGPIALIDHELPVVCVAPTTANYEKMISNIQEINARGGRLIIIATEGDTHMASLSKDIIYIPKTTDELTPILSVIPLQIMAYYIALKRGCDVDQPRNLAKSVTVE